MLRTPILFYKKNKLQLVQKKKFKAPTLTLQSFKDIQLDQNTNLIASVIIQIKISFGDSNPSKIFNLTRTPILSSLDDYSNQNKFSKPILSERRGLYSASKLHESKHGLSIVIKLRLLCCSQVHKRKQYYYRSAQKLPHIYKQCLQQFCK